MDNILFIDILNVLLPIFNKMFNNSDDDFMEFHFLFDLTDVVWRREWWKQSRIDWNQHLEMLRHNRGFQSRYHMSEPSFNKLVVILRSNISVDVNQSMCSSPVIMVLSHWR